MTSSPEPKLTYHPQSKRLSIPISFPDMHSIAGGAHFTAGSEHVEEEREHPLQTVTSHLGTSDVKLVGKRKQVVEDVLELFCGRPTAEIFERSWSKDAIYEDPSSKCHGYDEYAPQWFSLPTFFATSRTIKANVISSTHGPSEPNRLVYEQEQEYTSRVFGRKQVRRSLVVIDLDENDMIVKLEDKWEGRDAPTKFGSNYFRRLTAKAMPWFVRVPSHKSHTKK